MKKLNLNKLQSLEINTSNLKSRNKFYRLMNSQLALQCPKAKMYLNTKAYIELDYQRPLLVLWIPKMLTLLEWRCYLTLIGLECYSKLGRQSRNKHSLSQLNKWHRSTIWLWHSSNSNDRNGNGTIPEKQMVWPKNKKANMLNNSRENNEIKSKDDP